MEGGIQFLPPTASAHASEMNWLFAGPIGASGLILLLVVWAHHMFVAGISLDAGLVFSLPSYVVAVPSAIKVFNWTATLHKGWISFDAPMLYALGFAGLFTIGGLTGLFVANLAFDVHVTDTYFVVAHFHYIMVSAYFGGLHFWWPKVTGLEWRTGSPPPHNFDVTPTVTRSPYQYRPEPEPQDV